jgi:adenylosuccinate synthase
MPVTIVLGAQWGDEGKGKIVDLLSEQADLVIRFQGGANAGHTIIHDGQKVVLHQLPSGILRDSCLNLIGNGCVVDPIALGEEIKAIAALGYSISPKNLRISGGAHLVTPLHRYLDKMQGGEVGTTGRGIGPAYTDKAARIGLRLTDALVGAGNAADWPTRLDRHWERFRLLMRGLPAQIEEQCRDFYDAVQEILPMVTDTAELIHTSFLDNKRLLFEGAQGTLLDIDHGTYPFVTSSSTGIGGALTGTGVYLPFDRRIGVFKAYCTRVGNGPFPTEAADETGEELRRVGGEFGATTGRPRRCGWLDLPLLKKSCRINGFNRLVMTKLDCLSTFAEIRVAVGRNGHDEPEYRTFPGWRVSLDGCRCRANLPAEAGRYLDFIEEQMGIPLAAVSVGPERERILREETLWN